MKEDGITSLNLRMKCPNCGYWNRFEVEKVFSEQRVQSLKLKSSSPMYLPLKVENCKKCKKLIAETKELIRIVGQERSNR